MVFNIIATMIVSSPITIMVPVAAIAAPSRTPMVSATPVTGPRATVTPFAVTPMTVLLRRVRGRAASCVLAAAFLLTLFRGGAAPTKPAILIKSLPVAVVLLGLLHLIICPLLFTCTSVCAVVVIFFSLPWFCLNFLFARVLDTFLRFLMLLVLYLLRG